MSLTLVIGPANSAKAGEVLGAYAAAARRGAVLVVPTAADARVYERELAGGGALLGGLVLTFAGLAREIARRAGYAGRRLSALQRERVLARTVAATPLRALARSAEGPGFGTALGELVAELERSLVTPERFADALHHEELAALYVTYARELERIGRVDDDLYAWRALDALRTHPGRWGSDAVFFYGFDDLHPLQRDAVETLARVAGADVTVSLTYEPGRGALGARAETVQELAPIADNVVELPALDTYYDSQALHRLERSLFESTAEPFDPGGAVRLLEAGGARAEAELVAAEVRVLLSAGVPGDEIVVCHRAPATIAGLFERVFADAGIPLAAAREVPFAHTVLGRSMVALARCALLESASAHDALTWLRSPGVLERPEDADAVEAWLRRNGRVRAADAFERCSPAIGSLAAVRADPPGELSRVAAALLTGPHAAQAPVLAGADALDASALSALVRGLAELAELDEHLDHAELISVLEQLPVRAGVAPGPGIVLVAEPLAIRARRFRTVFVCGLQEGVFPRPGAPDPFLSDERRRELAAASGLRLGLREDALARERYLFYACVSRATEQIVLSFCSSDEEGNVALPSPFIAEVGELLDGGWTGRRRTRLLADVLWSPESAPTERDHARALAARGAPALGAPPAPTYELTEVALAQVRHRELASAGALESYADCPVKWLVERELQPQRFELESDAIARGSYIHAVLERLLARLGGPVTPESLPRALAILDELAQELPAPVAQGRPAAVRAAARQSIAADLHRYVEHEAATGSGWGLAGLELRFGFAEEEGSLPALELDGDVRVRGMIDRIDSDGAGHAAVRDYKSGSARPEHTAARWAADRQLQVALYMLAVRQLLGMEPVAGFYQPLGGGDLRARGVYRDDVDIGTGVVDRDQRSGDELDELLEAASRRAVELAHALRAGRLTPCPETCTRAGCAFPGICRAV